MRVALVHDWLTGTRGGERVLEALLELYPDADVFTLLHVPGSVSPRIEARVRATSFIQRLPLAARHYRGLLPLFPLAIELLEVQGYDLVVSSSHCVAKSVRTGGTPHLCYCHTPMRYAWDQFDAYLAGAGVLRRTLSRAAAAGLRAWDRRTARRADAWVANSAHVRERIERSYGRTARVVHPPVDVRRFAPGAQRTGEYVCAGALVPYKRIDLAVEAFTSLGRPLLVVGDGPEYLRLRSRAGRNITFTGRVDDRELAAILGRARALVMPMVEDFGIISVEAQAAGTPVVALGVGGARETVRPFAGEAPPGTRTPAGSATGAWFGEQTAAAIAQAVALRERLDFDENVLRTHAAGFAPEVFRAGMQAAIAELLGERAPAMRAAGVA